MTTISATKARADLYDLIDKVSRTGERIGITKKGETKAVLLSSEELEAWEETLEILANKRLMRDIREGLADIKAGRVYPLNSAVKD